MKQKLIELKGELDKSTTEVGDFNIEVVDRKSIKIEKIKITLPIHLT